VRLVTFTVAEANKALQDIGPRMERLVKAKAEFDQLQTRLEVMKLAVAGASQENPDARELKLLHDRRNRLAESISKEIAAIHAHGCLVKDLDRGLVDFHALAGDRLVFLCWQLGEAGVKHWHTLDGGFSSRQPLHQGELE
jgi:hypothetical protein